jgi:hypothetical protein
VQGSGAPMGPSASALHSRLQALRDVTNKKSAPPSGKDAAGKQRLEASAAATFEPSLTNSRAAATAERAVLPTPAPLVAQPYAFRSPGTVTGSPGGAQHPDVRSHLKPQHQTPSGRLFRAQAHRTMMSNFQPRAVRRVHAHARGRMCVCVYV